MMMEVKEKIKNKLDELNSSDLEKVYVYIDHITANRNKWKRGANRQKKPYQKVREILKNTSLTASDIIESRADRL